MNTNVSKYCLGSLVALSMMGMASQGLAQPLPNDTPRVNTYQCLMINNQPTTIVDTPRGRIAMIVWQSGFFSGGGWTPERRCIEVSKRFQQHENNRNLQYVSTGTLNGYNIICVAEKLDDSGKKSSYQCQDNGLILTLEHKDDPTKVMRELFNLKARQTTGAITRGSKPTTPVIDLEDFLENAEPIEEISDSFAPNNTPENVAPTNNTRNQENQSQNSNISEENYLDICSQPNSICSSK